MKKRNKLDNLNVYLEQHKNPDLLFLTETWLKNCETKYYDITGYEGVHNCRATKGGGVAIYIKQGFKFEILDITNIERCNIVGIKIANINFRIFCLYRSPKNNVNTYLYHLNQILENHKNIVIIGDININVLKTGRICKKYLDIISLNSYQVKNCHQKKVEITRRKTRNNNRSKGSLIDHVIAPNNSLCNIKTKDVAISDHKMLTIKFTLSQKIKLVSTLKNVQKTNYDKFRSTLTEKLINATETYDDLITVIKDCKQATTKTLVVKTYNIPWFNNNIHKKIKERDKAYKKVKKYPHNTEYEQQFRILKNQVTKLIKTSRTNLCSRKFQVAGNDMRKTWKVVSELMVGTNTSKKTAPNKLTFKGSLLETDQQISEGLNEYYTTMAQELNKQLPKKRINFQEIYQNQSIFMYRCTETELVEIIRSLSTSQSTGPDDINAKDIKEIFPIIKENLLSVINNCLKTGEFPESCKVSKVIPIYKKGSKILPQNYRPISLTSIFSKILEKAIKNRFYRFLQLSSRQYGFQRGSSTLSAAVDLVEDITSKLESKNHVIVVFVDLQKAFDTVQHDTLLKKLFNSGIRGPAYKLISSFLSGRKQFTRVNKTDSTTLNVNMGVPQGSVLGPLLYLAYVENVILAGLNASHYMFADDTALVYHGPDLHLLETLINEDLSRFYDWLCANGLVVNESKSVFMHFHPRNKTALPLNILINNAPIKQANSHKYLGLSIDDKLTWDSHIDNIINGQIRGLVGCFRRINQYLTRECKYLLYNAYIQSTLTYLMILWINTSVYNLNRLQRFQNKAIKAIFGLPFSLRTTRLYQIIPILPISKLKRLEMCKTVHKIKNRELKTSAKLTTNSERHNHNTRSAGDYKLPRIRTNLGRRAPMYQSIKTYNSLPRWIKSIKKSTIFTKTLRNFLVHHL